MATELASSRAHLQSNEGEMERLSGEHVEKSVSGDASSLRVNAQEVEALSPYYNYVHYHYIDIIC